MEHPNNNTVALDTGITFHILKQVENSSGFRNNGPDLFIDDSLCSFLSVGVLVCSCDLQLQQIFGREKRLHEVLSGVQHTDENALGQIELALDTNFLFGIVNYLFSYCLAFSDSLLVLLSFNYSNYGLIKLVSLFRK